jgi:MFS family permease
MPIWFQSIKNVSATRSGVMNLPMILGVVISAILSGGLVTKFGYYTPFMYIAPVIAAIGAGVLSTLNVDSGSPEWIGYQALYGLGIGLGTAQPIMVVQGALATEDIPSGTAIVVFTQSMGSAIFVSVAQTVFRNQLLRSVRHEAPDIDAQRVITAGAATVQQTIGPDDLPGVLSAYNEAITRTFYVGAALAAVAFLAALPIEWISMKRNRTRSVSK